MTAKAPKESHADPSQRQKFIDKVRELGCDEDEAAFERTLRRIVPKRKEQEKAPKK